MKNDALLKKIESLQEDLADWLVKEVKEDRYISSLSENIDSAIEDLNKVSDELKE